MKISLMVLFSSLLIASATIQNPSQFAPVPVATQEVISNQTRCQIALEAFLYGSSNQPSPAPKSISSTTKTNQSIPSKEVKVVIAPIPPATPEKNIYTNPQSFLSNPDAYTWHTIKQHKAIASLMVLSALLIAATIKYELQIVKFIKVIFYLLFHKKK